MGLSRSERSKEEIKRQARESQKDGPSDRDRGEGEKERSGHQQP